MSLSPPPRTDRRPALAVCAYDPGDANWDEDDAVAAAGLSSGHVRPVLIAPEEPEVLAATLRARLSDGDCRGLLLIGRGAHFSQFRIQMRASNRVIGGSGKLSDTGPATARTTAPVADILRELKDAGLHAQASSEGEHDVGSYLLYSVLTGLPDDLPTPAIGLLRAPAEASRKDMARGVRIAANAIADGFAPLRRASAGF